MILKQVFINILQESEFLGDLMIPLNPVPASRPRVTRWGTFYGKKYETWRQTVNRVCPSGHLRSEDPLLVLVEYVVQRPKKPTNPYPFPDVDNYDKATYDAITKLNGYWQDDKQIVVGMSWKRYARPGEEEGTNIEFYKMNEEKL